MNHSNAPAISVTNGTSHNLQLMAPQSSTYSYDSSNTDLRATMKTRLWESCKVLELPLLVGRISLPADLKLHYWNFSSVKKN